MSDPVGMTERLYARSATLLEARIEDELVALDRERGECFGFNETATAIWSLLETPTSHDALVAALVERFDVTEEQCRADLDAVLDDMIAMKLIAAT